MAELPFVTYSKRLEQYLNESNIKTFSYLEFSNHIIIGQGGFAVVYSAIFQGKKYALKSLNNNIMLDNKAFKQFKNEIKSLYNNNVNHSNIIKLYGFTRDPSTDNFSLVLQYANGGNLREHLRRKQKEGIYKISWAELINIAKEIASGLAHLHSNGIIHRDLHSKNILMDDGKVLITDFGLSKRWNDNTASDSSSNIVGIMAYVEPQCFIQNKGNVKRNEKSDIYSLGVLLWELTSGISPFKNYNFAFLSQAILRNEREKIIPGTPPDYANLYEKCWSSDPEKRPALNEILTTFEKLSSLSVKFIINNIDGDDQQYKNLSEYSNSSDVSSLGQLSYADCQNRIFMLGYCYEYGIGVEKDVYKAFKHYQESANMNYYHGIFQVGFCYYNGIGVEMNKHIAFEHYLKLAKMKISIGIFKTAICYYYGIGVKKNYKEFKEWNKKDP